MTSLGSTFMILGVVLFVLGLMFTNRLGPLGRLPGDVVVSRPGFTFYAPLMTSLLLSIGLSLLFWLIQKFLR